MTKSALLNSVKEDLLLKKDFLQQAIELLLDEGISNYPIVVASHRQLSLGVPLIAREVEGTGWWFNLSTLEEFYTKSLVAPDRIDDFRKVYKEHVGEICIFILYKDTGDFVFVAL